MGGKQMEGGNRQRRAAAREAREDGKLPSEVGETLGSSKQRKESKSDDHSERLELKDEGKLDSATQGKNEPRPGS